MDKKLILVLILLLTVSSAVFANESMNDIIVDLDDVEQQLIQSGTDPKAAAILAEKLEKGELWDSMKPNEKPISITKEMIGSDVYYDLVYQDRSTVTVSLTGGSYSSGSGYATWTGRLAKATASFNFEFSYKIDYTLLNNNYDYISSVYNKSIEFTGGTISESNLRVVKSTENSSGPAESRFSALMYYQFPPTTAYRSLSVFVGNNTAYPTWNSYY